MAIALSEANAAPMPYARRMRIALVVSLLFHALVVVLVGVLAVLSPAAPERLIPIEFVTSDEPEPPPQEPVVVTEAERPILPQQQAAGAAKPEVRTAVRPQIESPRSRPSNAGGRADRAPSAPRVLTAKSGHEPAGDVGRGTATDGPGGAADEPAGPTYGPSAVGGPMPVYPKQALDEGLQGSVTLSVHVEADGSASSVEVATSSGHRVLDDAAIRAVQRGWRFQPALANGKPVPGTTQLIFRFAAGKVIR